MAKWLVFVTLVFLGTPALSDDWKLLGGGWSHHLNKSKNPNETHNMVGIQYNGVSFIKFENSEYHEAYGLGYEYLPWSYGPVNVGGYAALWTGYRDYSIARPVAGLRATVDLTNRFSVSVTSAVSVTTVHLEWRLK